MNDETAADYDPLPTPDELDGLYTLLLIAQREADVEEEEHDG